MPAKEKKKKISKRGRSVARGRSVEREIERAKLTPREDRERAKLTPRERKAHDDAERLPRTAKLNTACFEDFQKEICACVPQELRDQGQWKYLFSLHESIGDKDLNAIMNDAIEKGRYSNHRIFIGSGSDGSSDDEIAVDIKFEPNNTKTTFDWSAPYTNEYILDSHMASYGASEVAQSTARSDAQFAAERFAISKRISKEKRKCGRIPRSVLEQRFRAVDGSEGSPSHVFERPKSCRARPSSDVERNVRKSNANAVFPSAV